MYKKINEMNTPFKLSILLFLILIFLWNRGFFKVPEKLPPYIFNIYDTEASQELNASSGISLVSTLDTELSLLEFAKENVAEAETKLSKTMSQDAYIVAKGELDKKIEHVNLREKWAVDAMRKLKIFYNAAKAANDELTMASIREKMRAYELNPSLIDSNYTN